MKLDVEPASIERAKTIAREFAEKIYPIEPLLMALPTLVFAELPRPSPLHVAHEPILIAASEEAFRQRWRELETERS